MEPASLANHINTNLKREASSSLKKIKALVKARGQKDLLRLLTKYSKYWQ